MMEDTVATTSSKTDPPEIAPASTFFDGTDLSYKWTWGGKQ